MPWSRHSCVVWCIFCTLALDARTTPRMQPWFEPAHEGSRCTAKSLYFCPRVFAMHNKRSLSFPVSTHIILGHNSAVGLLLSMQTLSETLASSAIQFRAVVVVSWFENRVSGCRCGTVGRQIFARALVTQERLVLTRHVQLQGHSFDDCAG